MANEIHVNYESENTLYAVIRDKAGNAWYVNGQAFELWGTTGRDAEDYCISLTDRNGSLYVGDFNENISSGRYYIQIFLQAGANPADGDSLIAGKEFVWSGTGEITPDKLLVNKAIQNKSSGQIQYFDDDGQTVLITLIPTEDNESVTRASD
ncbi:MAG: hypothetical protein JW787_11205 [Sedimentisphaerales bacterium]|nr:hypothetical protein [Sedimentisphaerales bacterium]